MKESIDRDENLLRRYDANARKRYLLGAACMVERTLRAAQDGQLLFPPDELVALEKAAAAMNELVDTWQNKPTSAYNRWQRREQKRKRK